VYARENGCPWDEKTTRCAAEKGHLECLQYASDNGCPWEPEIVQEYLRLYLSWRDKRVRAS